MKTRKSSPGKASRMTMLLLCMALLAAACNNKPNISGGPGIKLSVKDMRSDLTLLWSAIKEVHPGYELYTPADSMEKLYRQALTTIQEPMPEAAFTAHIYPFLSALGCGHTQLRFSPGYKPAVNTSAIPFDVLVHDQRVWVTTRRTAKLATGDEIISINDVSVSEIIKNGAPLYSGDGYIASFKELFLSEYGGFSDACNNYYHWLPPYHVTLRTSGGELKNIVLNAGDTTQHDHAATENKYASWTKAANTGDLGLYFQQERSVGLLEVPALNYSDTTIYEDCFRQIAAAGVKNLVLDMRHNGGGDLRITICLLSYLADSSFGIIRDLYARLPDPTVNSFAQYFDPEKTESFKGSCIPAQKEGRFYHMNVRAAFGKVYAPLSPAKTNRFRGNLVVLIDGATFSSAALFVTALKAQRANTIFVGRETAGTDEGCNGFAQQKLTLPATHITVDFPLLRVVSMAIAPVHGRGLVPEYEVVYTPQDVVAGRDPDLAKALTLIHR